MNHFSKRLTLLSLLTLLAGGMLWAQIPSGYYSRAEGKKGEDLRAALHDIIKGHTVKSYKELVYAYPDTDGDSDGKLIDIYSSKRWDIDDTGSYSQEGDPWNKEHLWCQSWFGSGTPKSDLFHVYPVDGYVNGRRSAYPFAEVKYTAGAKNNYRSSNGSTLGTSITPGYSGVAFEPADEYKGDVARSMFYMSVRYYTEDGSWKSSGMTNKAEILPWALELLMSWNEQDPVSQKEIDRNNKIYNDYQHNRNPFIDHPEYARMIWDENWTEGTFYHLAVATGLQHGSINLPETALEGSTVTLTALPDAGYELDSWSAWRTGNTQQTVTVSTNGTFTMPAYDVTISATFKQNTTLYDIALAQPDNGTISASAQSALSSTTVTLTAAPADGYTLRSWYVYKTGDMSTIVEVSGDSFVMPAYNVTVGASFVEASSLASNAYEKVTSTPADWSGDYLIVYEGGNVAFNGGLTTLDAANNTISVAISNNAIAVTDDTKAAEFTIAKVDGGYSIKSASGLYIGQTSDANGLKAQATALTNSIANSNGNVDIVSGGAYLRFNSASDQKRFRYYKSSTYTAQKAIQLYKKAGSEAPVPTYAVTFHNGNETATQTVNEYVPTALQANTFTKEGFIFDGWNTRENGTGTYYADGATVTLIANLDLYAQWEPLFAISCTQTEGGTISASMDAATEELYIVLAAEPEAGYAFYKWTVTDANGNAIEVENDQFQMPAADVTVSATFVYVGHTAAEGSTYTLVTDVSQLEAGRTYLIVNTANSVALGQSSDKKNYREQASVTISNNTINSLGDACELTLGGSQNYWTFYDASENGFLYASGANSNNYLGTRADNTKDDNGKWAVTISSNGTASIAAQGSSTHNLLKYNKQNTRFSCYATSSTGMLNVSLFVRDDAVTQSVILATDDSNMPEGQKNADLLAENQGERANVVLYGRTLYKDGAWNTLCLPFDLAIAGSVLDGATVKQLSSTSLSGNTLTLNFAETSTIKAGQPCLIKWAKADNLVEPLFQDVVISATQPQSVTFDDKNGDFCGTFWPVSFSADDLQSILMLGNNDTLYYPKSAMTFGAFHAYFTLANGAAPVRFALNFDEEATGISDLSDEDSAQPSHDLQGRRVSKPQAKGIYIVNGKKMVVK